MSYDRFCNLNIFSALRTLESRDLDEEVDREMLPVQVDAEKEDSEQRRGERQ